MLTFYLLLGILYGLALLWLGSLWDNRSPKQDEIVHSQEMVSILIPFRNEVRNLPQLFVSLLQLKYRPFEVVFVDDHSEDAGKALLHRLIEGNRDSDIAFVVLENQGKGKKEAIETAVHHARGGLLITTDADCNLPVNWIELYLQAFDAPKTQLAAGLVISQGADTFLSKFQQIEWASIWLMTQMGFGLGRPLMCSAANMAYRKAAFLNVGAYEGNKQHPSGDDEFLLKKISQRYGGNSTVYLLDNLVWTQAEPSWGKLYSQRARWASKWRLHASFYHKVLSFLPVLLQLLFLSSLILLSQGWGGVMIFSWLWGLKLLLERRVLGKTLKHLNLELYSKDFFLTSLWHPFYVVMVGWKAIFGKIRWKGRNSSQFN